MKRLRLALVAILTITILGGCGLIINYRGKIESKIGPAAEKVYPTKNLYDLFDKFPKGFTIRVSDSYKQDGVRMYRKILLYGNPENNHIDGFVSLRKGDNEVERVNLVYSPNGELSAESSNYSNELLPYKEFLFQQLTLNKKVLSKLKLISKSYSWETGDGEIEYGIKNKYINKFLHLDKDEEVTMYVKASWEVLSDRGFSLPIIFYQNQHEYRHAELIKDGLEEENND